MFNTIIIVSQIFLAFVGVYQFVISLFGIVRKRKEAKHAPQKSFAVLVAAHNEGQVVGALIENLRNLDYPKELYDIFVICDNCTDNTAEIARSMGVHAMERKNPHLRGKGHAIEWMLKELWAMPRQYDGIVMFDADNLVGNDFLTYMNNDLCEGHKVIQGYLDTKNPTDSWVTASYAITYWYCNRLWQLSRRNLNMANYLGGTGMCFETNLIKEMGWGATSLVEDLEFSMRCVKRGIHPVLNYDAKVYDEKPLSFKASARQRLRWMQGHFTVARSYFFPLLWASIKERSFVKFDAALYSISVYNTFLGFIVTAMLWMDNIIPAHNVFTSIYYYAPNWVAPLAIFLTAVMFPLVMALEGIKSPKMYAHLISMVFFQLSWLPITCYAFFTQNNKQWSHTQHTRVLRLEEVQSKQV
ncbi:cellulose synthase/poly-beta-1,6-N-acetylglucosamine synthase-like glycosyltransferase [Paenibacillus taihuensis]|uniref:Cellulose synthase/poly-beta-1,6-N-acetylglucosamine synthase-like glycosyltransferase n=1 Tax=Paenibacillus taihuensis TaxID=1156355 RepID=A0A3D9RZ97_9BACL|nr:glycosyltransferase family 2 protein [Paenibacillus taihuensis]REE85197.1 cellulose synthase/poly-beta-1,6-N-acetylglucosamine synthase-like glycosyltransferase [Paenibacillus taihuensis]